MSVETELEAIQTAAAIFPLTDRDFLRITGSDATRWLNGMVTNNIKDLAPGEGNYNFLLNAQGRIQGDCTIYRDTTIEPPSFILETDTTQLEFIEQLLDKFIIMDDVELSRGLRIENSRVDKSPLGLAITGPRAAQLLLKSVVSRRELTPFVTHPPPGTFTPASVEGSEVLILTPPTSSATYEVWCWNRGLIKGLYRVWGFYNASPISHEALEAHRILTATPKYGVDIRNTETNKDLPQETAQTHALHFNKGCYLGQEIVERIRSRGQVHRTFTQFTLTGSLPTLPAPIEAAGKPVGELTSAADIPGHGLIALGYLRREAFTQPLTYPGGTATPRT